MVHCRTGSLKIFVTLAFGIGQLTNASKGLPTRGVSSPNELRWLRLLCLSLVLMRCQPLRRALTGNEITHLFSLSFKLFIYIDNKASKK